MLANELQFFYFNEFLHGKEQTKMDFREGRNKH